MIFLRALAAPLYLVASSVLGLAATLGLTTFFFQGLLGRDELTYYVPFAAAVLLVALGSDYNVFVAGRIWKEARWRRLHEAIAVATPSAAKAITVAGIALAASFGLLAIVPLDAFQEFAFVMVVGVLIDTFIVRSLLIPALTALVGERAWWPGRPAASISSEAFAERVAGEAEISLGAAKRAAEAALTTLGERVNDHERREVARHLPDHLSDCLLGASTGPEQFPASEFLARMRERDEGASDADVEQRARAVLLTLNEIRARRPRLCPRPALRGLRSALRRAARRRLARRRQASLDAGGHGSPKRHSGQALEPSSQPVAGRRGQDPANHRSQQIGAGASEFTGVGFKNDLGRERREGREAAQEPDSESFPEVAPEPMTRHQQSQQERARDVDTDRGPDQGVGVNGEAGDTPPRQHTETIRQRLRSSVVISGSFRARSHQPVGGG